MKNEQLSFLESTENGIKRTVNKCKVYGASICDKCFCNRCKYSVEIYPFLDAKECEEIGEDSCFNCDECYYYGMDDEKLSIDKVKFKCDKFEMSNYYIELQAKIKRRSFKII